MKKPLRVQYQADAAVRIVDADDRDVCLLPRNSNETALEIVRAVNAHEALVGALRALEAMVRAFENGWPSHATESIGGLGHMPGESCNACRMMRPYKDAQSALAGKERTDGAE